MTHIADVLGRVMQFTPTVPEQLICRLVCRMWCSTVTVATLLDDEHRDGATVLLLDGGPETAAKTMQKDGPKFPSVHSIFCRGNAALTDTGVQRLLRRCPALCVVSVGYCNMLTDKTVRYLAHGCTSLLSVNLSGCGALTNAACDFLVLCTTLRSLKLGGCNLDEKNVVTLLHSPLKATLERLDLCDSKIGFMTSLTLPTCVSLRFVWLAGCYYFTDACVHRLVGCRKLPSVDLSRCNQLTIASVKHLSRCAVLQDLMLRECTWIENDATVYLAACPALRRLDLSGCQIHDTAAGNLARSTTLQDVNLSGSSKLTNLAAGRLAQSGVLRSVVLSECVKLTDQAARHLSNCSTLRTVDLSACPRITDGARGHLPLCTVSL